MGIPCFAGSSIISSIFSISASVRNPALVCGLIPALFRMAFAKPRLIPLIFLSAKGAFRVPSTSASVIRRMWRNSCDICCHPLGLELSTEVNQTLFKPY